MCLHQHYLSSVLLVAIVFQQKHKDLYENENRGRRKNLDNGNSSRSSSESTVCTNQVKDDKDGHLIYRSGDWLQNRCTKNLIIQDMRYR